MSDETPPAPPPKRAGNRGKGRPTHLTPELQAEFIKALEIGDSVRNVCALLGIPDTTYFRWMQDGETTTRQPYRGFWEAVQRARPKWRHNLIKLTVSAIQGASTTHYRPDGTVEKIERGAPDGRLALRLLALHAPEEFSEKHILEHRHSGPDGGPVVVTGSDALAKAVASLASAVGASPAVVRDALAGVATDDILPDPEADHG